ncbi:MAG: acetyl-CoA carboxylase biotin carboxyl carrier protein [Flavobacteriales bacterium]|nr:acetyl-CoA carboxylase biotin carboxyl carrier protein [Flavobacteriales bacterium]
MKLDEIQNLIKFVSKTGVTSVEIEQKDFKITIKTEAKNKGKKEVVAMPMQAMHMQPSAPAQVQAAPAPAPAPAAADSGGGDSKKAEDDDSKYVTIKSPMIGTFYRSPGPDKDSFVNVGEEVKPGKVICIIEAMKLFNEIESEVSGKIVKVLVDDATPVEYDQPLFLVDPS